MGLLIANDYNYTSGILFTNATINLISEVNGLHRPSSWADSDLAIILDPQAEMFILMKCNTGGISWTEATDPLFPAGDVYVMPFAGFIPQPLLWQTQPYPWRI